MSKRSKEPTRAEVAELVECIGNRVGEVSGVVTRRWPELGAHYDLNGARHRLEAAQRALVDKDNRAGDGARATKKG